MSVIKFDLPKPNSHIVITLTIGGPAGTINTRLVLDTGATHTFIRPGFFQAVGYDPYKQGKETVYTGSGKSDIWPVQVAALTVFGYSLKRFTLHAQKFPDTLQIDGVLGLNIFRKLRKTLSIDFANREISLT